jgi:hypothetical protein
MEGELVTTAAVPLITTLAGSSEIARYKWKDRGTAPRGYINGMAVSFARVYCKLKAGDPAALDMAKPETGDPHRDALTHYRDEFIKSGMNNSHGGADVLRHLFVLLMGLGMRESSGHYCEGRDTSATNTSADTSEAGLFQVSFNSRAASLLLLRLYNQYSGSPPDFIEIFKEGVSASAASLNNWGSGMGKDFQSLTKASPAFAVEYAAVALRHIRTHWGPINRKAAELRRESDELFHSVQRLIDTAGFSTV